MTRLRWKRHATPGGLTAAMALLLVIAWPWSASAQVGSSGGGIVIEGAKTTWEEPLDSATGLAIPCSQVRSRLLIEGAASSRSEIVRQIPDSLPDLDLRIRVDHSATAFRQDMSDSAEVIEGTAGVVPRLVIRDAGATMLVADLSVERGHVPATVGDRVLVEDAAVSEIRAMTLPVPTPPPTPPAATAVTQPAQPAPHEQPAPGESHPTPIPVAQPIEITRPLWPWFAVGAAAITVAAITVLLIVRRRKGLRPRSHREPPRIDPRGDDQ